MNLVKILEQTALDRGACPAFIEKKEMLDYNTFLERAGKVATVLKSEGIQKGDQILLLEPISTRLYLFLVALWSLGATVVIFDPSAGRAHIEKCLTRVELKAFIGMRKAMLLKCILPSLRRIPKTLTVDRLLKQSEKVAAEGYVEPLEDEAPALITFTSGSTNIPKAIVRTHYFLIKQYEVLDQTMDYQEDDIDLPTMPVFTLANQAKGITTVIPDDSFSDISKLNARRLIQQIKKQHITRLSSSPTVALLLAEAAKETDDLASIRRLNIGGGPIFPNMLPVLKQGFKAAAITIVYGSSEAEPISELDSTQLTEDILNQMKQGKGLFVGKPVNAVTCQLVKGSKLKSQMTEEELTATFCKINEPGEIIVTGEHVLKTYLHGIGDEENKIKTPRAIWHRTGDLGCLDESGNLWLLGRAMATTKREAHTLYPFAIECEVCVHYNVPRAAYLFHKGKHLLIIEEPQEGVGLKVEDKAYIKEKYQLGEVITLKQIPLDTRHRAKVEYGKLIKLIEKIG